VHNLHALILLDFQYFVLCSKSFHCLHFRTGRQLLITSILNGLPRNNIKDLWTEVYFSRLFAANFELYKCKWGNIYACEGVEGCSSKLHSFRNSLLNVNQQKMENIKYEQLYKHCRSNLIFGEIAVWMKWSVI
jgi:hypothetical protein